MTARRAVAVALVIVGAAALAIGLVKLLSEDSEVEPSAASPAAIAAALSSAQPAVAPFRDLTEVELGVGGRCMRLVVADALDERVQGLRSRRTIGEYDGMLFVFDTATDTGFTMSTVPIPLDIGFYDAKGRLVSTRHMKPCPDDEAECPTYRSDGPFTYAIETLKGELPSGSISMCPS
ncbi:MAG: DUF192 domain-containing protein [Acidimicrobiia bacterium]